jgi:hypothetical protein
VEWRNVSAFHNKRGFWSSTQLIVVFGKTDKYKFNTYAQRRKITQLRWGGYSSKPQGQLLDYWDDIPFVYAGSVRHPEAVIKPGTNRKVHPTQMPVNLAVRCILFSTDVGDTILDPFSGSDTTGVACIKLAGILLESNERRNTSNSLLVDGQRSAYKFHFLRRIKSSFSTALIKSKSHQLRYQLVG